MGPPGDFGLADLILRVLEAWELGNTGLYRKYRAYKKSSKFQNFILVLGVRKTDFYDFSGNFYEKKSGIRESMTSETAWLSMASETAWLSMASETASQPRQPASSSRDNGFSVLRICLTGMSGFLRWRVRRPGYQWRVNIAGCLDSDFCRIRRTENPDV